MEKFGNLCLISFVGDRKKLVKDFIEQLDSLNNVESNEFSQLKLFRDLNLKAFTLNKGNRTKEPKIDSIFIEPTIMYSEIYETENISSVLVYYVTVGEPDSKLMKVLTTVYGSESRVCSFNLKSNVSSFKVKLYKLQLDNIIVSRETKLVISDSDETFDYLLDDVIRRLSDVLTLNNVCITSTDSIYNLFQYVVNCIMDL